MIQTSKTKNLYASNKAYKGTIVVTDAKSKSGKSRKSKGGNGDLVLLVNLADPAGGCPKGSLIKLCHTITDTCVQKVALAGNACSCSLSIPSGDSKDQYSIKVNAPNFSCSGGIGSSCVQKLDVTDQTDFCVQLQPIAGVPSSTSSSSVPVIYHQTQVIVVKTMDQSCMSDAVVKVSDCGALKTLATFTTTPENCATSFILPKSETEYCLHVIAANHTCSGSISSDCTSGPIAVPANSNILSTYEIIMHSTLGTVELSLNISESFQKEICKNSITYYLINQNGAVEATKVSGCQGVSFPNTSVGVYTISYQAIYGYTCGGMLINGNQCQSATLTCTSAKKTTIIYIIDKIMSKPTSKPALPPVSLVPVALTQAPVLKAPTIPSSSKPSKAPIKSPVKPFENSTYIAVVNVIMIGQPVPGAQVDVSFSGTVKNVTQTCITSAEGKCQVSSVGSNTLFATVTPPQFTTCQNSCSVEIKMKSGEIPEYTVFLEPIPSAAIVNVVMGGKPVPGTQVGVSSSKTPNTVVQNCSTSTEGKCNVSSVGSILLYNATVIPKKGTTCKDTCSVEITMKPGEIPEYTVVLVPVPSDAIIYVVKAGKPVPGVHVDIFANATPNIAVKTCVTSMEGKCLFTPSETNEVSFTATVTPIVGTSCQKSCSVNMTLVPGETPEYTVVLSDEAAALIVKVKYDGISVPGAKVNFSFQNNTGSIFKSCSTSTSNEECILTIDNNFDLQYLSTVTAPAGYSCPETGCSASFTLLPGKKIEYTFNLIKLSGEAIVTVLYTGKCAQGAQVKIFDPSSPATILESFTTTSSDCNVTFTTKNFDVVYQATVTPPSGSYLCSGDFDNSCSTTFKIVAAEVTKLQCVLVKITAPPLTASPTKKPLMPPTAKPTTMTTKKPLVPPTPKPTMKPTKKPGVPPTMKPTEKPVVPPTPKPTMKPTEKPVMPPTPKPTMKPTEKPVLPPTPKPTTKPTKKPVVPPTPKPTMKPTEKPVMPPTPKPTMKPTEKPVVPPTPKPTMRPTAKPVVPPTPKPTKKPVILPTPKPTIKPTEKPLQLISAVTMSPAIEKPVSKKNYVHVSNDRTATKPY